jgi:hypothetical protein
MKLISLWDIAIITVLGTAGILSTPFLHSLRADTVTVSGERGILAQYPLEQDCEFVVQGRIGPMKIAIRHGCVSVVSSTCNKQICVHNAAIQGPSEQIICVPNRIVVRIAASSQKRVPDAISR